MSVEQETVKFGGQEFKLGPLSIAALRKVSKRFNDGLVELTEGASDMAALDGMLDVVYLGLSDIDKSLTKEAFEALHCDDYDTLNELFNKVLFYSGLRRKEVADTDADPLAPPTPTAETSTAPSPAAPSSTNS